MLSIIIPTYNEEENVSLLNLYIARTLKGIDHEVIFVDDSTDNTPRILEELSKQDPQIRSLHRSGERGLGSAVVQGLKQAKGEFLAVMDADLQHPPELLPVMLKALENGAEIVIPSRFVRGGNHGGLKPHRKLASWTARAMGKVLLRRLRGISDPTGGFFMLRRQVVERVQLNPIGWKILIEILVKGNYATVAEIPYTFAPRVHNKSKMSLGEQVNYLKHLIQLVRLSPVDMQYWQSAARELSALLVGSALFYLIRNLVPDHLAALLAALAYIPANRMLNLPDRVRRFAFAPTHYSTGRFLITLATGTGWTLGVYLVCSDLLSIPPLISYLTGSITRTGVALTAPGIWVPVRNALRRATGIWDE